MFRRKEENATDASNPASAGATAPSGNSHAENAPSHAAPSAQVSPSTMAMQSPSSGTSYVPSSTSRSPVEPARTSSPASSYRPTPIAEFNRGASRGMPEAMRTSAPAASSASSFGSAPDKSGPAKSNRRVLTVGNDILLKGEIATCDRLVIEGRVEAKLSEVHTVEIAECGSFKGTAEVEDAEISGVFEGDLIVRNRLVIYASGEVRGNISYGEIEIERGGRLTGQIKTGSGAAAGKAKAYDTQSEKRKETVAA